MIDPGLYYDNGEKSLVYEEFHSEYLRNKEDIHYSLYKYELELNEAKEREENYVNKYLQIVNLPKNILKDGFINLLISAGASGSIVGVIYLINHTLSSLPAGIISAGALFLAFSGVDIYSTVVNANLDDRDTIINNMNYYIEKAKNARNAYRSKYEDELKKMYFLLNKINDYKTNANLLPKDVESSIDKLYEDSKKKIETNTAITYKLKMKEA